MTYTWQIVKFDTKDQINSEGVTLSDAVVTVKWRRVGTDSDNNSAAVVGYTTLSAAPDDVLDFDAFATLTKETVVGWLETTMSANLIASYDATIVDKLSNKNSTEKARPWG
ncbi:MAG: DUF7936 family protein [Methylophagaceae bacterium]|jgi:hypothetical protein|tara:strand:+ start:440 stop:772 length:333 start_codon:yes stop_codon:yes gene_type:complete